jgi:hypothetical protein
MEDWTADSDEPKKFSRHRLNGCDLCVLLVAFRRGYVPDGETLSVTQLEYEAALKQGIDILPYMLDENAPWPHCFVELDKDPGIKRWRDELRKRHGVEPFNLEPRSIDMTGALGRWLAKQNRERRLEMPTRGTLDSTTQEVPTKITWDIERDGSPYPGLMHFTRKHTRVFFGRDDEIREILYLMRKPEGRFIIISGGSGTGKSSLVDAGVLPRIEQSGIGEKRSYVSARMVPSQGGHPFDALLRPLYSYAERAGLNVYELAEKMAAQPSTLPERIQEIVSKGLNGNGLILFLDQMEELFTAQNPEVSNNFLTAHSKRLLLSRCIQGDYRLFTIYERKPRVIAAAPFRDRVVHHAVMNLIEPPLDRTLISDSYACRLGRGVHAAANRYQAWAQTYRYVLKIDVQRYFPSIDHELLKIKLRRRINDRRVLDLLDRIIDGSPNGDIDPIYFPGDNLFTPFERRAGIPIGNLTSQFFANLYLDDLETLTF